MTALEILGGCLAGGFLMLVGGLCPESTGRVLPPTFRFSLKQGTSEPGKPISRSNSA